MYEIQSKVALPAAAKQAVPLGLVSDGLGRCELSGDRVASVSSELHEGRPSLKTRAGPVRRWLHGWMAVSQLGSLWALRRIAITADKALRLGLALATGSAEEVMKVGTRLNVFALTLLAGGLAWAQDSASLESRALAVVRAGTGFESLAREIAATDSRTRAGLRVRVRARDVEFRFSGRTPHTALGGGPRQGKVSLEYLAGPEGVREDELLLALSPAEQARLVEFGQALRACRARGGLKVRLQLVWVEEGRARVEDLRDVFGLAEPKETQTMLKRLNVTKGRGLGGGTDLVADPTRLPRRQVQAELLVTISS